MKITILGTGAFGSAIATIFNKKEINLWMWSKFEKEIEHLKHKNPNINYTTNIEKSITNSDLIIVAIPVNFIEDVITNLKEYYNNQDILIVSKGINNTSLKFSYQIITSILGNVPIGVISGGSFAIDMTNKNPLGLTLATTIPSIIDKVKKHIESPNIKVQYTNDIIGVSICGSIKNVMAIGFGILDGQNQPDSTKFLYLTNAIYEIKYLISILNGKEETILSYAGIDDIMMTCTSKTSRNYTLGKMLGEKRNNKEIETYKKTTTIEGLGTAKAIHGLAEEKNINLPLTNTVYEILYQNKPYTELLNILKTNTW